MSRTYFVYILASETHELYVGVTRNLERRVAEHLSGYDTESYSFRHSTTRLVYFEMTTDVSAAIRRELGPIERVNPRWRDLADT